MFFLVFDARYLGLYNNSVLMLSVKEADEKIYSHTPLIEVCRLS